MPTGAAAETEAGKFSSSKQASHVQSLEAELAADAGPRLPQPMHKGQAETRVEVRRGKSLDWRTEGG